MSGTPPELGRDRAADHPTLLAPASPFDRARTASQEALTAWARTENYARASRATAYRSDWVHFEVWCRTNGLAALLATPQVVGAILTAHATALAPATLGPRLSSIAVAHRLAGHQLNTQHPALRDMIGELHLDGGTLAVAGRNPVLACILSVPHQMAGVVVRVEGAGFDDVVLRRARLSELRLGHQGFHPRQ